MIKDSIRLYDEPPPVYTSYNTTTVIQQTPEQKEAWNKRCIEELDKAKQLINVGDSFITKNNTGSRLTVCEFIDNVADMQRFANNPCVLRAKNLTFVSANLIQYSIDEIDWSSLMKKEIPDV